MLPSTGWLPLALNAGQSPESVPLPIADSFVYADGPQGEFSVPADLPPWDVRLLFAGPVAFIEEAGFIGVDTGFKFTFMRLDAYNVLLIDMLDPPDAERDTEVPDVPITDKEPCPSNDSIDLFEACCSVLTFWIFDGSVQFNGTRTFGALP